jgi:hypothetical protein
MKLKIGRGGAANDLNSHSPGFIYKEKGEKKNILGKLH